MIMCGNVCAARTFNCAAVERWTEISCSTFHVCTPICRCECAFLAEWERSRDKRKKKIQRTLKFFDLNWICRRARRKHWPIPWTNRYTTFFLYLCVELFEVFCPYFIRNVIEFTIWKKQVYFENVIRRIEKQWEKNIGGKNRNLILFYMIIKTIACYLSLLSQFERERENCIIINMNSMDLI